MVEFTASRLLLLVLLVSALTFADGKVKRATAGQQYRQGDTVEIIVNSVRYVFVDGQYAVKRLARCTPV
jgi:hypothetical protein